MYNEVRAVVSTLSDIDGRTGLYYHAPDLAGREPQMRANDERSSGPFSYLSPEHRVPADPLWTIRAMTDDALRRLSPRFKALYATTVGPRFLRSICSELYCSRSSIRCEATGC